MFFHDCCLLDVEFGKSVYFLDEVQIFHFNIMVFVYQVVGKDRFVSGLASCIMKVFSGSRFASNLRTH